MAAVTAATSRSRSAFWLAAGSIATAGGTILYLLTVLHPHG
jgi:hypothetical protein